VDEIIENSSIGRKIRINRLFHQDGFAICVAADHGFMSVPSINVFYLRKIVKEIIKGRADGILLSPGQTMRLADLFARKEAPAIILRCDWINATRLSGFSENVLIPARSLRRIVIIHPRDALKLGVVAVVTYLILGYEESYEAENIFSIANLARECHDIGLPFGVEPIAAGAKVTGVNMSKILEYGVRLSVELGADFLKIPYSGDIDSFKCIVKASGDVPVLVLGGSRSARPQDAIDMAADAKIAGARGVVFGRNVTQADDPRLVVDKLCQLFHGTSSEEKKSVKKKIIVNSELCTNCNLCVLACNFKQTGKQGLDAALIRIDDSNPSFPNIHICNQCGLCIKECKQEALFFLEEGGVGLDVDKCNGCGQCVSACPQGVIKMSIQNTPYVCDLCQGRPECVDACPTGALTIKEYGKKGKV
jgi:class I fructose-bisphosphate aldolase